MKITKECLVKSVNEIRNLLKVDYISEMTPFFRTLLEEKVLDLEEKIELYFHPNT